MGFTTGFTGGVTLTLGVVYLTLYSHRRNREHQAAVLRQQTYLLSGIVDPLPPVLPPTRAELAAADRSNLTEAAKERWNAEIENAVRWAQAKDWTEVREGVEAAVGRLWTRAVGEAQDGGETKGAALLSKAREEARETKDGVAAAAKSAYADAKAKGAELAGKTEEKAGEARGGVMSAIGRGIGSIFGKAEKNAASTASPTEKALQQRYEKSNKLDRTVEETLAARYDQKDKTKL